MVKSFAANEKLVVVAEWSDNDSNALKRHVFERSRLLEFLHVSRARLIQRIISVRQEPAQTNIESVQQRTKP